MAVASTPTLPGGRRQSFVDLSCPLYEGMWSYREPHPPFTMRPIRQTGREPRYSEAISMGVLTGTYLETAAHVDPSAQTIDRVPLDRCIVPAVVIDVPTAARHRLTLTAVDDALVCADVAIRPGDAVLLRTGWESRVRDPGYVDEGPRLGRDLVEALIDRRVGLLGADLPRFDEGDGDRSSDVVRRILEAGVLLLAPLIGLADLGTVRGTLIALPLRIVGATASPCRAIFVRGSQLGVDP